MSFFDQPQPVRKISDHRVAAWGKQKIQTHNDASYRQKAQQAQDAVTGSSYTAGRSVNNVNPLPARWNTLLRDPISSTISGKASNASSKHPQINDRGQSGSDIGGEHLQASQQANTAVGSTNFAKDAPSGLTGMASSSSATGKVQSPASKGKQNGLPPHLRRPSIAPTEDSTITTPKSSKHGTRAPPSTNSGAAARSAKFASKYPCTYDDCDLGFVALKAMKKHKEEIHHYCRFCDEDFDDWDQYLSHKIETEEHICCCVCGEDFRSEAGRDRHQRQLHAAQSNCRCVGCGCVFPKGSLLIQHIHENECRDKDNRLSTLVNRDILKKQRAQAALHLDALSHAHSDTSRLIAAMQPPEDDEESAGGVPLEPHLLDFDKQEPTQETVALALDKAGEAEKSDEDLMDFSEASPTTPAKNVDREFPTLADAAKVKGKSKQTSMIEKWNALTINDTSAPPAWDAPLSVSASDFVNFDYRRAIIPGMNGSVNLVATDWDHRVFKRHAVDGKYHCPFTKCDVASMEVDNLKRHLTSGIHQGTDHRCIKCLRKFKNIQALIAHMESNSERCRIKDTDHFGQILSVVSGGFLGVKGRNADGTVKISALNEEELADQAIEQRALLPHEDPNFDWSL